MTITRATAPMQNNTQPSPGRPGTIAVRSSSQCVISPGGGGGTPISPSMLPRHASGRKLRKSCVRASCQRIAVPTTKMPPAKTAIKSGQKSPVAAVAAEPETEL